MQKENVGVGIFKKANVKDLPFTSGSVSNLYKQIKSKQIEEVRDSIQNPSSSMVTKDVFSIPSSFIKASLSGKLNTTQISTNTSLFSVLKPINIMDDLKIEAANVQDPNEVNLAASQNLIKNTLFAYTNETLKKGVVSQIEKLYSGNSKLFDLNDGSKLKMNIFSKPSTSTTGYFVVQNYLTFTFSEDVDIEFLSASALIGTFIPNSYFSPFRVADKDELFGMIRVKTPGGTPVSCVISSDFYNKGIFLESGSNEEVDKYAKYKMWQNSLIDLKPFDKKSFPIFKIGYIKNNNNSIPTINWNWRLEDHPVSVDVNCKLPIENILSNPKVFKFSDSTFLKAFVGSFGIFYSLKMSKFLEPIKTEIAEIREIYEHNSTLPSLAKKEVTLKLKYARYILTKRRMMIALKKKADSIVKNFSYEKLREFIILNGEYNDYKWQEKTKDQRGRSTSTVPRYKFADIKLGFVNNHYEKSPLSTENFNFDDMLGVVTVLINFVINTTVAYDPNEYTSSIPQISGVLKDAYKEEVKLIEQKNVKILAKSLSEFKNEVTPVASNHIKTLASIKYAESLDEAYDRIVSFILNISWGNGSSEDQAFRSIFFGSAKKVLKNTLRVSSDINTFIDHITSLIVSLYSKSQITKLVKIDEVLYEPTSRLYKPYVKAKMADHVSGWGPLHSIFLSANKAYEEAISYAVSKFIQFVEMAFTTLKLPYLDKIQTDIIVDFVNTSVRSNSVRLRTVLEEILKFFGSTFDPIKLLAQNFISQGFTTYSSLLFEEILNLLSNSDFYDEFIVFLFNEPVLTLIAERGLNISVLNVIENQINAIIKKNKNEHKFGEMNSKEIKAMKQERQISKLMRKKMKPIVSKQEIDDNNANLINNLVPVLEVENIVGDVGLIEKDGSDVKVAEPEAFKNALNNEALELNEKLDHVQYKDELTSLKLALSQIGVKQKELNKIKNTISKYEAVSKSNEGTELIETLKNEIKRLKAIAETNSEMIQPELTIEDLNTLLDDEEFMEQKDLYLDERYQSIDLKKGGKKKKKEKRSGMDVEI